MARLGHCAIGALLGALAYWTFLQARASGLRGFWLIAVPLAVVTAARCILYLMGFGF